VHGNKLVGPEVDGFAWHYFTPTMQLYPLLDAHRKNPSLIVVGVHMHCLAILYDIKLLIHMLTHVRRFWTEPGAAGKRLYRVNQFEEALLIIGTPEYADALHQELMAIETHIKRSWFSIPISSAIV
jgi:hypothetical protein